MYHLPCFRALEERVHEQEQLSQNFCQRMSQVHVLLDGKAGKRPFEELSTECRLALQKQAASLELLGEQGRVLEASKADVSVYEQVRLRWSVPGCVRMCLVVI